MNLQETTHDINRLVTACNQFGFKLLAELCEKNPETNVFISSAGIAFSLALIQNGAGGNTRKAIAKVLELPKASQRYINETSQKLFDDLISLEHGQLSIANSLWIDKGLSFDASFLKIARNFFKAEAATVDFNSTAAAQIINTWVHRETKGKIATLIERSDLDQQTDCVLANAVYFKGVWKVPFSKQETHRSIFHLPRNKKRSIWMMRQSSEHDYLKRNNFQAVRLRYTDDRISSYIFVPADKVSLTDLLKEFQVKSWNRWIQEFALNKVEITVPRFKMTYEGELREALAHLGMGTAFDSGADFSPMGLAGRYIGRIKHKSVAEFNEEGTEAAATTAIMMTRSLFEPPRIVVDRPFFWAIQDQNTGLILFFGAVFDPGN